MKRKITAKEQYTTYAKFPLVAGDVRAYEVCLDLGENISGAEFKVTAIRADGKAVEDLGFVKDGIATYTMASDMYSVPGELVVRLAVLHESSVLTDREIVFEVLEGTSGAETAQTVVPLNDSVILRLGSVEQKLENKVDKIQGKGLSANDFTNEYKEKLDSIDQSISEEIENHNKDTNNPHQVTAVQVGAYTKKEMDAKLNVKANKSDVSNVYKFCGSVKSEGDLPFDYTFECNGAPYIIAEGQKQEIGTFIETTGEVAFNNQSLRVPAGGEVVVIFPVKTVTLKAGWYDITANVNLGDISVDEYAVTRWHEIAGVPDMHTSIPIYLDETEVTEILVHYVADYSTGGEVYFNFSEGKVTGSLNKIVYEDEDNYGNQSISEGVVYNVLDTGMNYAWNGTDWDALGGEHKDIEARTQIGKVDEALDGILSIQNSLMGGDSV